MKTKSPHYCFEAFNAWNTFVLPNLELKTQFKLSKFYFGCIDTCYDCLNLGYESNISNKKILQNQCFICRPVSSLSVICLHSFLVAGITGESQSCEYSFSYEATAFKEICGFIKMQFNKLRI